MSLLKFVCLSYRGLTGTFKDEPRVSPSSTSCLSSAWLPSINLYYVPSFPQLTSEFDAMVCIQFIASQNCSVPVRTPFLVPPLWTGSPTRLHFPFLCSTPDPNSTLPPVPNHLPLQRKAEDSRQRARVRGGVEAWPGLGLSEVPPWSRPKPLTSACCCKPGAS